MYAEHQPPALRKAYHERDDMSETTTLTTTALHERVEAIFRKGGLNVVQAGALARDRKSVV